MTTSVDRQACSMMISSFSFYTSGLITLAQSLVGWQKLPLQLHSFSVLQVRQQLEAIQRSVPNVAEESQDKPSKRRI